MRRIFSISLITAGFCLGAAISYFNWTPVSFNYLSGETELPLIALLLGVFLAGMLLMGLLNAGRIWSLKRDERKLRTRVSLAETELKNLRNLSLDTAPGANALTPPPAPPAVPPSPASRARDGSLAARDSH